MPVSIRESLDCISLMHRHLAFIDMQAFYFLSRMTLVKDEKYYDRFDLAFDAFLNDLNGHSIFFDEAIQLPVLADFLVQHFPNYSDQHRQDLLDDFYKEFLHESEGELSNSTYEQSLAPREDGGTDIQIAFSSDQLESPGNSDSLGERVPVNIEERRDDAGEGGTDELGSGEKEKEGVGENGKEGVGENGKEGVGESGKEGVGEDGLNGDGKNGLIGAGEGNVKGRGIRTEFEGEGQRSANKVWLLRQFEDYDTDNELGTRNLKMALRRLRKFARTGAEFELDLADTIRCTARNAGLLDIREVPERRNNVKVLLFLDVGGSMDDHIELCKQLFVAAKSEFKHLETFYFHNFIYGQLWSSNEGRRDEQTNTMDLIHKYGRDYKIIFVGDANMAREEIADPGGSVEHFNKESGQVWLQRIQDQFNKIVWLNPVDKAQWPNSYSAQMINRLLEEKMYHLSVDGIEQAMKFLAR